jgi:putative sterol carrier protein
MAPSDPSDPSDTTRRWRDRLRDRLRGWPRRRRRASGADDAAQAPGVDAFAREIDFGRLSVGQFIQVLETMQMLGEADAGFAIGSLSTETLVAVVGRLGREQLAALAEHQELRYAFIDEIYSRMADQLVVRKAKHASLTVSWRLSGGAGREGYDRYQTLIEDGACVSAPDLGRDPDATLTLSMPDFIRAATGNAALAALFVRGRVRVKGDYGIAASLAGYFTIPKP